MLIGIAPFGLLGLGIARLFTGGHLVVNFGHFLLVAAIVVVFSLAQGYAVALSMKRVSPRTVRIPRAPSPVILADSAAMARGGVPPATEIAVVLALPAHGARPCRAGIPAPGPLPGVQRHREVPP